MIESPSVDVLKGHLPGMPSVPKLGQVVFKLDLVQHNSCQKRPSNLHHSFIKDSSYHLCKDLTEENKENPQLISNDLPPTYDEVASDPESIVQQIAAKIEERIREAKRTSLECGEVLVPCNLTQQIAHDVITMSESEPCGLRGGVLFVLLDGSGDTTANKELRRVGCVKIGDPKLVPTFEMYLTLKRTTSSWLNQVSNRLFRNFNSRSRDSIVISDSYQLSKKKLYRDISA